MRLGRQRVSNCVITVRMEKNRGDGVVYPPMLPVLAKTITASQTGDLTFFVTERGRPFVKEYFGNWFREVCREAGCPGSAHGLRKVGATRAAENGATVHQLTALLGWKTENASFSPPPPPRCSCRHTNRVRKRPHLDSGAGGSEKQPDNSITYALSGARI
jgi:hypothetical protein